ncbi:hypothetical protein [Streptomyces sp. NBC_00076]|uniref:hypothetical protein n=1 Tax=Streptomyces sp. NBC_00076 TaxID=2975642 RepID=UPI0038689041
MIQPDQIPQFTGSLPQLETDYADLKKDATHVRSTGAGVHSQFQGLSAYYTAPEAEQLFATTKPVKERADDFATDLETVSGALSSYATEIQPLVTKLEELKAKATTFVSSVKDDDEWEYDGDKVDEHNQIRDDITATVAAFWAAERTCHNTITALWGGTQMVAGDGSDRKDQYGFAADDLKDAKLPWGDPVEEKHKWYEVGHWVKSFVWDGLIVDGVWGTIKGLGTLVGFGGWDAMGQAWKGLAQLATGLALSSVPGLGAMFWTLPDDKLPSWIRDSRTAMKETGKALVAWDEWGKNPGRAAGAVTFNVLTTVFTGGAGGAAAGAGKAGAVAKALSVAGKAGRVIDPMTYIAKGAGAGLSKIGDIAKGLKGVGAIDIPTLPEGAFTLPEGALKLPDGTVRLPEGAAIPEGATRLPDGNIQLPHDTPVLPAGTTKLPSVEGSPAQYMDPDGNLLDHQGNVIDTADNAPTDVVDKGTSGNPASGADVPRVDSPVKEPALVGAGAHTADQAGQSVKLGDSLDTNLGDVGRVPDNAAVHAGGESVPTVHAGGDGVSGGHAGDQLPGGAAEHLPGGRADDVAQGPTAGHEPPSTHAGGSDTPQPHHDGPTGGPDGMRDHGDHTPGGTGGDHTPADSGADVPPPPHDGDFGGSGAAVPEEPRGNLPDGSWEGENGLRLDHEANAAADDFMRRSQEAEPHITESMQSIAGRVDNGKLIGLEYRLKGEDSLKRKLATDMLEDIGVDHGRVLGDIKDSIRYTMEVPADRYTHGVQQAVDDLQAKGFENVTFKNTWDSAGYKGINSTWRDPTSGQVFELQFHTADSFTAKMDGHVLYEKERLPGVSTDELAAIKLEQTELFGRVPVPHGAGEIRLGGHGPGDAGSSLGRELGSTSGHVASVGGDVGRAGSDGAHMGHDGHPAQGTDAPGLEAAGHGEDATRTADGDGTPGDSPYTEGPHGGWSGAGWVEKPDPIHDPDSVAAAEMYENIRATDNKVELPEISRHTGVDESVLRQVKSHLFRAQHEVAIGPDTMKKGLFTPRKDIGELWFAAREGKLGEEGIQQFKNLMAHEYVESSLMKSGLPYIREYDHLWELDPSDGKYYRPQFPQDVRDAGAHDLAPNDKIGGFRHWRSLGMEPPKVELANDLSNIGDVVKAIHQQLRLKGMDLW